MKTNHWILTATLFLTASLAQAQDLTLNQLIDQTLKTNQDVQQAINPPKRT